MKIRHQRALSFVAIMIIVSLVALFLRFSIEQLIKLTITQNQAYAQDRLKLISTALENYARDHRGVFPASLAVLIQSNPPYIGKEYVNINVSKGYSFSCPQLEPSGYNCYAAPTKCNFTGKITYAVTIGGLLTSEECAKKE